MHTTAATIHTTGARVTGSYMGVPVNGTVVGSRAHTINHRMFLVTVEWTRRSVEAVRAAGYGAGPVAQMAVGFEGEDVAADGTTLRPWVKVVEADGSWVDFHGTRNVSRSRVDLGGAPWDWNGRPV